MKGLANLLKRNGRFGDTDLLHVTPEEIDNLESSLGGELPRNPQTGLKEANPLAIVLAIIGASAAQGAYSASQSRKAQKRAREEANTRELIEGSAPNLSNVAEVIAEDVQGTDVAGLEEALAAMDYGGGEVPIPSGEPLPMEDPTADLSEAELMALLEQSGIAQMASGGPVGTPEDVYYFSVPQVMGMMQDPNPQVQGVGMQLADMMASTPGMEMVPATRDQITMMAEGGPISEERLNNQRLR
jgi:hypothetical protein